MVMCFWEAVSGIQPMCCCIYYLLSCMHLHYNELQFCYNYILFDVNPCTFCLIFVGGRGVSPSTGWRYVLPSSRACSLRWSEASREMTKHPETQLSPSEGFLPVGPHSRSRSSSPTQSPAKALPIYLSIYLFISYILMLCFKQLVFKVDVQRPWKLSGCCRSETLTCCGGHCWDPRMLTDRRTDRQTD